MDNGTENTAFEPLTPPFSGFESVFAWLCLLFGYLFCRAFPLPDNPLGMFIIILVALCVTSAVLFKKGVKICASALTSAALCVVFGAGMFISADAFAQFFAFLGSVLGYSYFVYTATGNKIEKGFSDLLPADFVKALFIMPFRRSVNLWVAMFSGKKSGKLIWKILLGAAVAVVPTFAVATLLSYDEGFTKLLEKAFYFLKDFSLISHLFSLSVGGIIAMYVFGMYFACTEKDCESIITAEKWKLLEKIRFLPALTTAVALIPLIVVYVFFFVSQWQYYVSGFSGTLPEGLSYATYARNGFFELCTVSAINFFILFAVSLVMKRQSKGEGILLKAANVVISLMTLVLIATAMSKMALYIQSYGLTQKRVVSSWFMILLALIFVIMIVKQFVKRMKLIPASGIAVALMLALLTLSNYNGIIADYNVDRYIAGDLDSVDLYEFYDLGTPALPALLRYVEYYEQKNDVDIKKYITDDSADRSEIKDDGVAYFSSLYVRIFKSELESKKPFTAFSVPDMKAKKALEAYLNE
ncbi:MAG: DUF4173 domain-containing protein [Clostridia bacterium]|nr:DUF4173 domain-containing protein [Clostridia bacterium]